MLQEHVLDGWRERVAIYGAHETSQSGAQARGLACGENIPLQGHSLRDPRLTNGVNTLRSQNHGL